ncbi:MAG: YIP1 family protein [Alphaproteobacteria bacterium]|nr:YIP1 family protein [Alphaproteobacteria bacterium]
MDIVSRVKNIITTPNTEWPVIAGERTDPATLYTSYIIPLAAIPAVCSFIGLLVFGIGPIRLGFGTLITLLITQYVSTLVGVGVIGFIFAKLAPSFGGQDDLNEGLKLAAYAATPSWIGGVFSLIPALGIIGALFGLYGLYLLYLGIPVLMKNPREKTVIYAIAAIIVAVVIAVVIGYLQRSFIGF